MLVKVHSSQEAPDLFPIGKRAHLEEIIDLLLHWLARSTRRHFIAYEVSTSDSPITLERVGFEVASCSYLL